MKDLIIFGDSFAAEFKETLIVEFLKNNKKNVLEQHNALISYHSLLRNSNKFNSVTSYGIEGDDLWHQFKKFQEVYTGEELVVLFETGPNRLTSPEGIPCTNYNTVTHLQELALKFKDAFTKDLYAVADRRLKVYSAAAEYFLYLQRDDFDKFVHNAIIEEMKRINPNILIIPCFKSCKTYNNMSLVDITNFEFKPGKASTEVFDLRRNHLTEENHQVLANQIIKYFTDNTPVNFDEFIKTPNTNVSKYFTKL